MKATAVIRQRTAVRPSIHEVGPNGVRRGPRAAKAEMDMLRRAAGRLVLDKRTDR